MTLTPPLLSAYDVGATGEGSIDPLSLAPTYDRLANRLLPHLTVRMKRPRYLTAIAAGAHVCEPLADQVASDGRSPAWLVFEWYVVEALVRNRIDQQDDQMWGLPGVSKVGQVLRFGRRLGADTYLKTPTVFGFTGVYLRLARALQIVDDDLGLDENGIGLLRAWEQEQGLDGFISASRGAGADLREACREAVTDALKQGHTCRTANWPWWKPLHLHFRPDAPGKREREVIVHGLLNPASDPETAAVAREYLEAIVAHGQAVSRDGEAEFMRRLMPRASAELSRRLGMVNAYEAVARLLTDGFALIRHLSTKEAGRPIGESDFSARPLADHLTQQLPRALDGLEGHFAGDTLGEDVISLLQRYRPVATPVHFFAELLDHHETAQRNKPPDGKRPWIERATGVAVRPQYQVEAEPEQTDDHVHDYRTASACSFLQDLGRLPR